MERNPPVLLSYAFRPFFLLNAAFAILAMAAWVMVLHGSGMPGLTSWWHAHEMIIGFALAAVAGFSLTAVSVWTGRPAVFGLPLGLLVLSWLAGRIAMTMTHWLPPLYVLVLDMLFPVMLSLLFGREVISSRNRRNYVLAAIVALMAIINLLYHAESVGWFPGSSRLAVYLLIHGTLVLVTIIAGRITPAFTRNWLHARGETSLPVVRPGLDWLALTLTVATGLAAAWRPMDAITGVLALSAAAVHGARLSGWRGTATISNPLLFVLHATYAWLPVGYAMLGCSVFGWLISPPAALHVLTIGAAGSVVLAVMTRVSLGHTGRPLEAPRAIVFAYLLLALAVVARAAGSFMESGYLVMADLSAAAWMLAFIIFIWVYWPILTRPRPDGA